MKRICPQCQVKFEVNASALNRANKIGAPLYCGRKCFGLSRRLKNPPTKAERKAAKRLYDAKRRLEKEDEIKAAKREYFKRTYDPAKAAIVRKERMPLHVEYCRRPEYKKYKSKYDAAYRAKRDYGDFWEAGMLLVELDKEIDQRATYDELAIAKGTLNKAQTRRREYENIIGSKS